MRRSPARQPRGSQGGTAGPPCPERTQPLPGDPRTCGNQAPLPATTTRLTGRPTASSLRGFSEAHCSPRSKSARGPRAEAALSARLTAGGRANTAGPGLFSFSVPPARGGVGEGRGHTPVYITSDWVRSAAAPRAHGDPVTWGPFCLLSLGSVFVTF